MVIFGKTNEIPFFLTGDKDTKVCTIGDIQCYVEADRTFSGNLTVKQCNCLPDCTTLTYDVEISQAPSFYISDLTDLRNSLNETE